MQLFIIEGPDRVGKDTLISNLSHGRAYLNLHFTAPPKEVKNTLDYQFNVAFLHQLEYVKNIKDNIDLIFWNRSHLGEYVYGQLYRNEDKDNIVKYIYQFEKELFKEIPNSNITIINLSAPAEYLISNEDGNSFSADLDMKNRELELFNDVCELSLIRKKINLNIFSEGKLMKPIEIAKRIKM